MKSLSCQQRNYFIDRIKETINKEIGVLEQIHAASIEKVADKQFNHYLKETGLAKMFKDYEKKEKEYKAIEERMRVICQGIWEKTEYPGKEKWSPSFYGSKSVREFLRQICNALAREGFIKTPKGKRLRQLEEKRTAAIDVVMGMTETEPTVAAINKVLKGTKVPLLGDTNG